MTEERKHWKIYRGSLHHHEHGNTIFWATSKAGIKKRLAQACREDKGYHKPGDYAAVFIPPTRSGLVEWLDRNVNLDNG